MELNKSVRLSINLGPPESHTLVGMESAQGALPLDRRLMALATSSSDCGSASVLSTGTRGSLAMAKIIG